MTESASPVDHTARKVTLGVWQLAWPTALSVLLQISVSFVDFLFVGQLGADPVAGLGAGTQILFLQFGLFQSVTAGTAAIVARAKGANDPRGVDAATRMSVLLSIGIGTLCMVSAWAASPMLQLFGLTETVVAAGATWLSLMLLFSIPAAVSMTMDFASRAAGDVRTPLTIGALVSLLNASLDYVLIFGNFGAPAMGVRGAALASGIAFTTGFALWMALWIANRVAMHRTSWRGGLNRALAGRILKVGIPTGAESVTFDLGLIAFVFFMSNYGTPAVTAYFIGARILFFSLVPGVAFNVAASTLVGQHLGAGAPEAARAAGWRATRLAVLTMSGVGLLFASCAHTIAGWFAGTGAETVGLTVEFVYIMAACLPFMAVEFSLGGALRGAGDTRFPLLTVFTGLIVVRLGSAWLVVHALEGPVVMVWWCLLGDYSVKALMLTLRFRAGAWKKIRV